jgi:hypothetical protein
MTRLPLFGTQIRVAGFGGLRLGEQNVLRAIDAFFDRGYVHVDGSWITPRGQAGFRGPVKNPPRGPAAQFPHARRTSPPSPLDDVAETLRTPVNNVRWWRQEGTGPEFFKIGRRLYTTVGDLRTFISTQRLASRPVLGKPKAV